MTYDLIIIGAGPAGITAAVYAARKRMKVLVVSRDIGGQAALSGDVENYTGYQFITGPELAAKFEEHMRRYEIELKEGEAATDVRAAQGTILVKTSRALYESKTVIIASGKRSRELNVPGEKEFRNKGVSYCATCDAPLFGGKDVAVIGGGNSALDAVVQLMRIARHIYLVNNGPSLGGDEVMREKVSAAKDTVTVFNEAELVAVRGEKLVGAITIRHAGIDEELSVEGVFVEIGLIPNAEFAGQVKKNERGEIVVDCYNQTSVAGVYAAGDVTNVPEKQIIIAAGEGAKAALGVFRYLTRQQ